MKNALGIALFLLLASPTYASGSLGDMAWIEGHWRGKGLGGECDETWSPAAGGVMLGTFRLVRDGQPVFYEFLTLSVVEGNLSLKLKHFNPDMKGWEQPEKFVEFRHVKTTTDAVEFEGLKFVRQAPDRMTILVSLKSKDGSVREEPFELERKR